MKPWIKSVLCFLIVALTFSGYAFIPKVPSDDEIPEWMKQQLRTLHENEERMENEIIELKSQRGQPPSNPPRNKKYQKNTLPMPASGVTYMPVPTGGPYIKNSGLVESEISGPAAETAEIAAQESTSSTQRQKQRSVYLGQQPYGYYGAARFSRGITVTSSPLLGLKSAFDASDLLYQYPNMNEDLILLRQRGYFQQHLVYVGDTLDNRAIIVISGGIEAQVVYNRDFTGFSNGDVNLSTAELDITPLMGSWANGFIALDYDSSAPATGSRVENSRIYLSRGFLTIGNLEVAPVYMTIGQMYVPFGRYSSAMLTTPLTESVARIQARAALLGYYKHGFYSEIYGFQGNDLAGTHFTFRQGGANMGYQTNYIDFGAGYVTNIADSQGMQNNGINPVVFNFITGGGPVVLESDQFAGFAQTPGGNELIHAVPGGDLHMEFNYKLFTFISEFITGLEKFAVQDMTFNYNPASVKALHLETDLTFHLNNKPIIFALIYGETWDSLALNLPKNTYAVVLSTSIWKNTMMGIEYRHDINYGTTNSAAVTGVELPVPSANIGGTRNMVTLQFGAYF